ncbi:hypothetical protein BDD12DRAFT_911365 [Trichophaea hybrida]|nr:hypothetical protein BDD12DRAFT_911365 [Trichophaea hybrida]
MSAPPVSYPPQPSRMKTIAVSHSIIKEEEPDIRPQSPQPPPAHPTHFVPTPTPTPQPEMRHSNKTKTPRPKERILKIQPPQDQVNYPCHENLSPLHRQQLVEVKLYPADGVSRYTRRIPFKGSKGALFETTGRNQFDVYEYRFTAPNILGDMKQWWMMWDYYNGLTRIHDLFECCKPGKTEPGNALKNKVNPGLLDLCPNITGGNLHAQDLSDNRSNLLGYWVPYEAARAMAAKFCYKIRYALTPIFGEDFPDICLPETHEDFGKYDIDPAIITRCQQRVNDQKRLETERRRQREVTLTPATPRYATPAESTPGRPNLYNTPPDMGSIPREQPQSRFFDPVRNGFTGGNSQRSDILSPANRWNSGPDISTPPSHGRQLMSPENYSQYSLYESSAQLPHAVRPVAENNRYHPYGYSYNNYSVRRSIATPTHSPAGMGGSPQMLFGSPAESLISNDVSRIPRLPPYPSFFQAQPPMSPEYSPSPYPPIMRTMPESSVGKPYIPHYSPIIPQHRESPISRHELDVAHDSKRRCVPGQPSPPPEYYGRPEESSDLGFAQIRRTSMVPAPVNSYTRSPMPPMLFQSLPPIRSDSEKDVAEAAAGLMDLRRKDTELENSKDLRRNSA